MFFNTLLTLVMVVMLSVAACSPDKGSVAAQLEKAAIALDNGNFQSALDTLNGLCDPVAGTCSDTMLGLLAEARMGLSGVQLTNLLDSLDAKGIGTSPVFDAITVLFGGNPISAADVTRLNQAVLDLDTIAQPTADDQLQRAMAAATHLVAEVVVQASADGGTTFNPALVPDLGVLAADVTRDVVLVLNSAAQVDAALGTTTGFTTDLNALWTEIEGPGGDRNITVVEITAFLNGL